MEFDKTLCCGCGACANICPTKAISWVCNAEGFWEPAIDQNLCVDCGMCRKVCPYETSHVGIEASPQVYAAVHRDASVVMQSSSGGVFTALSDYVLGLGGVVYGVGFDTSYHIRYMRVQDKEERNALRGSKYVQCDGKDLFALVEQDLRANIPVMLTGTPCQISGIKLYLEKGRIPTSNLYCVDNVCHGVASPLVWDSYLSFLEYRVLQGAHIEALTMRSKRVSWQRQEMCCETSHGDVSDLVNQRFSWNKLYRTTFAVRESCFHCRYTSYDRVGDITLADYWNIENAHLSLDYSGGVNLVLVNNDKGAAWLAGCADQLVCEESNKRDCWQMHLERPQPPSKKRANFWKEFATDSEQTIERYVRGSIFNKLARAITPFLRKVGLYALAIRTLTIVRKARDHEPA